MTKIRQEELHNGHHQQSSEKIGSLTNAVSNEKSITINRIHDVTTVATLDRITGKAHDGDLHRGFAVWEVRCYFPQPSSSKQSL
jgi:hypothetical protein